MESIIKPKVQTLTSGKNLVAKQMQAKANSLMPAHQADKESILLVLEGNCEFRMMDEVHHLKVGDSILVPAKVNHQIKAIKDFKAVHFMPKDIQFEFFDNL